jgi:hypothetical protein
VRIGGLEQLARDLRAARVEPDQQALEQGRVGCVAAARVPLEAVV